MDKPTAPKKILIVEDEAPMLNALSEKFTKEGFAVLTAEDGVAALELSSKNRPDVILLDILLPRLDGMEVLRKIRMDGDWGKKVPVVILSNVAPGDKVIKTISKTEPSFYLVKTDWKLYEVVEKVRACFRKFGE